MQYIFFLLFFHLFACLPSAINRLVLKDYVDGTWFFFLFVLPAEMSVGQARRKKTLEELTIKTSACSINYRQECSLPDRPKKKWKKKKKRMRLTGIRNSRGKRTGRCRNARCKRRTIDPPRRTNNAKHRKSLRRDAPLRHHTVPRLVICILPL